MANSLVIRRGTSLAKAAKALRAAQYVRMSRELQRYSIKNQLAAIAVYAEANNLTIVRTYADEGRSGLRIKGRPGLIELIEDVQSGLADFDHILVYDVSRWGRFQDVDESAYYEFLCKRHGARVHYCAEQFANDGTFLSGIAKNMKRGMAAEWSRELSVKVHAGHCRIARLGYRVGAPIGYGLRRMMVDEDEHPKCQLARGQSKALQSDRVRLRKGTPEEVAVIRWIFDQFVIGRQSYSEIRRLLNDSNIANHNGRPWSDRMIYTLLGNENYVGNIVYNRTSRRLGARLIKNPKDAWVRGDARIEPIVDPALFAQAQRLLADRRVEIPEDQMLLRLRLTLRRRGKLNSRIINTTLGLNHVSAYVKHFGSLRRAYALIGYSTPRDCEWLDSRKHWSEVLAKHVQQLAQTLSAESGLNVIAGKDGLGLTIDSRITISFMVVRHVKKKEAHHAATWRIYRTQQHCGLLVLILLASSNKAIEDYALLPCPLGTGRYITLSEASCAQLGAVRFATMDALIREIRARVVPSRGAPATREPKSRSAKSSRTRARTVPVRN